MDVGAPWIYPYIGGGVGYAWSNLSARSSLHPGRLPAAQQSLRPDRRKLRLPGDRRVVIPDSTRSRPVADHRVSFLRCAGQRKLRRLAGGRGSPSPVPVIAQGRAPVQPQLPARRALCIQRRAAGAGAAGTARARSGGCALLSGVLRLGQGDADRPCAPDHQGCGRQLHARPVHAHRGERLYRHLGHAAVQPGALRPPRPGGAGRTGQGRRAGECHHHPGLRRHPICWCRPDQAFASHRTAGWRSSFADRGRALVPRSHRLRLPYPQRAEHHRQRGKSRGHADGEPRAQLDSARAAMGDAEHECHQRAAGGLPEQTRG